MRSPEGPARRGYISLLAMSFTLGLALVGGAMATGLRTYIRAAAQEQRGILDRIALESAAAATLGRLAAGGPTPLRATVLPSGHFNGHRVQTEVSLPEGKRDLRDDPPDAVAPAFAAAGVAPPPEPVLAGLESLAALPGLSARQEDCLRRLVTLGRSPEEFRPVIAAGTLEETFAVAAGDQVDLRLALEGEATRVLWVRARFTGQHSGWKLHDYRLLTMRGPEACAG